MRMRGAAVGTTAALPPPIVYVDPCTQCSCEPVALAAYFRACSAMPCMHAFHSTARLRKGSHLLALCAVAASLGFATHKHRLPVQYTPRSIGTAYSAQ